MRDSCETAFAILARFFEDLFDLDFRSSAFFLPPFKGEELILDTAAAVAAVAAVPLAAAAGG